MSADSAVADLPQAEAPRRRHLTGRLAVPGPDHGGHLARAAPPRPTSTSGPTRLRTIWWQKALASISNRRTPSPSVDPAGVDHPPHQGRGRLVRAHLGAATERREVVRADERVAAQAHALAGRAAVSTCQVVPARNGFGHRPVEHGVAVATRPRPRSGRRSRRRPPSASTDHDRATAQLGHRPAQVDQVEPVGRGVEADHLTPGVHPGVGATGAGQLDRTTQHPLERVAQRARRRWSRPGWRRSRGSRTRRRPPSCAPATTGGRPSGTATVAGRARAPRRSSPSRPARSKQRSAPSRPGSAEPGQTSSMRAMGALSPWRGPSLRMRV